MSSRTTPKLGTLILLLSLAGAGSASADVTCPADAGGHRLSQFGLFHGDPTNQKELAPVSRGTNTGYTNVWDLKSSKGLVAVCSYDGGSTSQLPLPEGISQCRADGTLRKTTAACK